MTATLGSGGGRAPLLTTLLRGVSRSFYLTLRMLPSPVRDQVAVAYLFARGADTVADTDLIDPPRRLELLRLLKSQFERVPFRREEVHTIRDAVLVHQPPSSERVLLERLEDCFHLYLGFSEEDRRRIELLMVTLIPGMEMDVTVFSKGTPLQPVALDSFDDLDRYIYQVAGCVGEFWTYMVCAHLPSLSEWDQEKMVAAGVRFGKGLQLTNVVKDLARDLHRGRCYIPASFLAEVGLTPQDLLQGRHLATLRPVLLRVIRTALAHLDQGWQYTMAIPAQEVRLRLACLWPILFAGETLRRVAHSSELLDPAVNVKMSKGQVYRFVFGSLVTAANSTIWTAYWGGIRKKIL